MTLLIHATEGNTSPRWITAIAPTPEEIETLKRDYAFSAELLDHALDPNERSRVRVMNGDTFLVLRVPWFAGAKSAEPFTTIPLGLQLGGPTGLSICGRDAPLVRRLAQAVDQHLAADLAPHVVLSALELTAEDYQQQLEKINRTVDEIEERLQRSLENREVLELLRYQKSLVYFTTALDAMSLMLERLEKLPELKLSAVHHHWLEDVRIELHQALDTSITSRNVMSEMMDAFASIISNNLNVVMKFLAAVTVVVTLPGTLASFYGMNVDLPGQRSPWAFSGIAGLSIIVSVLLLAYFRKRNWL